MYPITKHLQCALQEALESMEKKQEYIDMRDKDVIKLGEVIIEKDKEIEILEEQKKLETNMRLNLMATIKSHEAEIVKLEKTINNTINSYEIDTCAIMQMLGLDDNCNITEIEKHIQLMQQEIQDGEESKIYRPKYRRLLDLIKKKTALITGTHLLDIHKRREAKLKRGK